MKNATRQIQQMRAEQPLPPLVAHTQVTLLDHARLLKIKLRKLVPGEKRRTGDLVKIDETLHPLRLRWWHRDRRFDPERHLDHYRVE